MHDEIYDRIEQAMAEAEKSRRDAYEESIRRRKAEKDAIEAIRRVNISQYAHFFPFWCRVFIECVWLHFFSI